MSVQDAPAPSSIVTVPLGVPNADVTLTPTEIDVPTAEGSTGSLVIVVTVDAFENVCDTLPLLDV